MLKMQSLKKNTIFNAIKTVSAILFPLITFPYISRILLPENVGKINFSASIVSYFSLIATLGIQTYAIRECSAVRDDKEKLSNTASQIFSINIITTTIAYIALGITLIFYSKLENYRVLIVIQSLAIIAATLGADWLNSAMEDFKYITLRTVFFQFVSLALMFIFVRKQEDYMKYAVIGLVSSAGANIVNIWYRRRYCRVRFVRDIKKGIEWKRHTVPILCLFVMLLAQTIFHSLDSTMLGLINGDREVGIYSAAHKMSNIITQLVTSLLWVIMPRMSYLFEKGDYTQINKLLKKVLGFNALLGLPCTVGAFMLSNDIILLIAGKEFINGEIVLKILMVGFIFTLFGGSFIGNTILLTSKKENAFMIICCITAVVNIITNYIFIPKYGAIGAAGTTSFCDFVIFATLLFTIDKRIKLNGIIRLIITPIIGCLGIILVCLLLHSITPLLLRIILRIILSTFVYFIILYLEKNEITMDFIREVVKRWHLKNG